MVCTLCVQSPEFVGRKRALNAAVLFCLEAFIVADSIMVFTTTMYNKEKLSEQCNMIPIKLPSLHFCSCFIMMLIAWSSSTH